METHESGILRVEVSGHKLARASYCDRYFIAPNRALDHEIPRATLTGFRRIQLDPSDEAPTHDRKGSAEESSFVPSHAETEADWDLQSLWPILQPPLPGDFRGPIQLDQELWGFQRRGVVFLAENTGALLGDDMGTGKTIQSTVAMLALFRRGEIGRALVLAPLNVTTNWARELRIWAPDLRAIRIHGSRKARSLLWQSPAHVYVAGYESLRSDLPWLLDENLASFDLLICDEAQRIKNRRSQLSRAVKEAPCRRRWALTGTPVENSVDDLGSIFEFLIPGLIRPDGESTTRAKRRIKPYFLRRRKADVLPDLPAKTRTPVFLSLAGYAEQRRAYQRVERTRQAALSRAPRSSFRMSALAAIQEMKQILNVDPDSGESAKADWLMEKLEEIVATGQKALVFSQYRTNGVDFLHGKLRRKFGAVNFPAARPSDRPRLVDRFQNDPEVRVFVSTPMTGGVGLNLTAGSYVFHFDQWWNPAVAAQAEDRAHRYGQMQPVSVYELWIENSFEQRIQEILERKKLLYEDLIESQSEDPIQTWSNDELAEALGVSLREPRN